MNGGVWPWALAGPLCSEPQAQRRERPQASPQDGAGLPVGRCAGFLPTRSPQEPQGEKAEPPHPTAQPPLRLAHLHGSSLADLGSPDG